MRKLGESLSRRPVAGASGIRGRIHGRNCRPALPHCLDLIRSRRSRPRCQGLRGGRLAVVVEPTTPLPALTVGRRDGPQWSGVSPPPLHSFGAAWTLYPNGQCTPPCAIEGGSRSAEGRLSGVPGLGGIAGASSRSLVRDVGKSGWEATGGKAGIDHAGSEPVRGDSEGVSERLVRRLETRPAIGACSVEPGSRRPAWIRGSMVWLSAASGSRAGHLPAIAPPSPPVLSLDVPHEGAYPLAEVELGELLPAGDR